MQGLQAAEAAEQWSASLTPALMATAAVMRGLQETVAPAQLSAKPCICCLQLSLLLPWRMPAAASCQPATSTVHVAQILVQDRRWLMLAHMTNR